MKCSICGKEIKDDSDLFYGDESTYYDLIDAINSVGLQTLRELDGRTLIQ
ncbi:MAG: hypothetical protein ACTSVO_05555 [Candidatus Heimdallarchaeaceae archaeon]